MIDRGDDMKHDRSSSSGQARAAIPGDPFPWEPEVRQDNEKTSTPSGSTPTPADSGDPTSFDLGGGD